MNNTMIIPNRELSSPLIPWNTMKKLVGAYEKISAENGIEDEKKTVLPVSQIIGSMEQANRYNFC